MKRYHTREWGNTKTPKLKFVQDLFSVVSVFSWWFSVFRLYLFRSKIAQNGRKCPKSKPKPLVHCTIRQGHISVFLALNQSDLSLLYSCIHFLFCPDRPSRSGPQGHRSEGGVRPEEEGGHRLLPADVAPLSPETFCHQPLPEDVQGALALR